MIDVLTLIRLELVVEPWIDGLWEALDKCPNVKIPRKTFSKVELNCSNTLPSPRSDLESEKVDSGEVDQLLGQLRDVTLKEGTRR
jgi:hypothetical protein